MIVNFEIGEPPRHMYYLFLLDYSTIGKERTFTHDQLGLQHVSYSPIFSRSKHYLEFTYQKNEVRCVLPTHSPTFWGACI